jgi:hypothetical protein
MPDNRKDVKLDDVITTIDALRIVSIKDLPPKGPPRKPSK